MIPAAMTQAATPAVRNRGVQVRGGMRKIAAVKLHEFRSYKQLLLERDVLADARAIVLTGGNGVGKTNLLEALSMLSPGRGLRRAALPQMIRRQSDDNGWSVHAIIRDDIGETNIATALAPSRNGRETRGRSLRIDGANESLSQLAHIASILWLTPAIERAVAESAGERRRFLDRIVMSLEPEHGARSTNYERAMRERNRLLQTSGNAVWIEGLEEAMAKEGALMQAARRRTVAMLSNLLEELSLPAFPKASIALAPDPDADDEACDTEIGVREEEENLRTRLREGRLLDRRAGRALAGAHRCDFRIRHLSDDGEMPLQSCSSGEQKALLLGLVLAHGRLLSSLSSGGAPILLLDEVTAHLDAERRHALFDILEQSGAHSWMTGTDPALFQGCQEDSCFLEVTSKSVERAQRPANPSLN